MERQGTVCIGLDDQTEYALGKDEILSHLNSMCEMTRVGAGFPMPSGKL